MRSNEYIRSISTVHRPIPLIVMIRAISSSSSIVAATSREGTKPDNEPSAIALIVAIFVAEKPQARRRSKSVEMIFSGVGNVDSGKAPLTG